MKTIANADIKALMEALAEVGQTKIPIPLAIKMVEARRKLVDRFRTVEEVRVSIVQQCMNGSDAELNDKHPGWESFVTQFHDLMSQTFEIEGFTLYHRATSDGDDQYAWTPEFRAGLLEGIEPNTLMALMEIVDIVDTPAEEG